MVIISVSMLISRVMELEREEEEEERDDRRRSQREKFTMKMLRYLGIKEACTLSRSRVENVSLSNRWNE